MKNFIKKFKSYKFWRFALLGASLTGLSNNLNGSILLGTDFYYKNNLNIIVHKIRSRYFSIKALNKLKKSSIGLNNFLKKLKKKINFFPIEIIIMLLI